MEDIKTNITNTGEPVGNQALTASETAPTTTTPAAASNIPAADKALAGMVSAHTTTSSPADGTLPAGYLSNGSMVDAEGIMHPDYLEKFPQALAKSLKPLSASSFQRAFLTKAKAVRKKKIAYSAKKNCAQEMVTQALKLVSRKKDPAPRVLLDMVKMTTATVEDDATFDVLYMHLDAIYIHLLSD